MRLPRLSRGIPLASSSRPTCLLGSPFFPVAFFGLSSVARQLLFLVACLSSCRARFSVRALVASHPPFCLGGSFRGVVFRRNHVSRASGHHSPSPEPDVMVSLLGPALAQALMRLLPQSHGTEKDANNQPLVTS